jgi:ABC-type uncharacterized transport system ATPase subunit
MIDGGRLVVAGPTDSLLERTGVVTVDVGDGDAAERLVTGVAAIGMVAETADGVVQITVASDGDLDRIRDAVAELGLPLYRLGSRLTSLDEVFFERAAG